MITIISYNPNDSDLPRIKVAYTEADAQAVLGIVRETCPEVIIKKYSTVGEHPIDGIRFILPVPGTKGGYIIGDYDQFSDRLRNGLADIAARIIAEAERIKNTGEFMNR